jgi:hypothetical protein
MFAAVRSRSCAIIGAVSASLALAACGGGARQDASEPNGNFHVQASAAWTTSQTLSQHTKLVITTRNMGNKTIPDVAVTITDGSPTDPHLGTRAQAFQELLNMPGLASQSRPVWIVDQAPGTHAGPCPTLNQNGEPASAYANNYSACTGGPGGAVTAYSNTWALGPLRPGKAVTFEWHLTAVKPGTHYVYWRVAAGLNGKAKAIAPDGMPPRGSFTVNISHSPAQAYVDNNGRVVTTP